MSVSCVLLLPTPAAITAGPLVFRLAFFESVFVQAGFFLESTYRVRVVHLAVLDVFGLSWAEKSSQHGPCAWFWVPWEGLSEVLEAREASWSILETSWAVLGRKRWPTWLQLGSQNGSNIDQYSKPKAIKLLMPLGVRFLIGFG